MAGRAVKKRKPQAGTAAAYKIEKAMSSIKAARVFVLGNVEHDRNVRVVPTGSLMLDYHVLGIGGFPRGRITEVSGEEGTGKTTLVLHAVAGLHRSDPDSVAFFDDMEHAIDPAYAAALGCDLSRLLLTQPDCAEDALQAMDEIITADCADIACLDSVASLVPRAELEGDMDDMQVAAQARLMNKALRKLTGKADKTGVALVFTNQLRQKFGAKPGQKQTQTVGGRALRYYASVRLEVSRLSSLRRGDEVIGNLLGLKCIKHKQANPFKSCEVELTFGKGINLEHDLFQAAELVKLLAKVKLR